MIDRMPRTPPPTLLKLPLATWRAFRTAALLALVSLLAGLPDSVNAAAAAQPLTAITQNGYLERAEQYRQAGNHSREQLELTNALHAWPDSTALRHAYALHLVRRKNLTGALLQTTHSLSINRDQPATANLHLLLLEGLGRAAESAGWVNEHLRLNKSPPPLELWSNAWLERWQAVLQLGRKHAAATNHTQALAQIESALNGPTAKPDIRSPKASGN